jgi:hypothetical protein
MPVRIRPDGVRLVPGTNNVFRLQDRNTDSISCKDLAVEPITMVGTDFEYHNGKIISVDSDYLAYAVRAGEHRPTCVVLRSVDGHID